MLTPGRVCRCAWCRFVALLERVALVLVLAGCGVALALFVVFVVALAAIAAD